MRVTAIVPALNPEPLFPGVVQGLVDVGFSRILVVNDGSGTEFLPLFEEVKALPGVVVLTHNENQGKGRSLKTAIDYYLEDPGDHVGVVTLDADGQHGMDDVVCVAKALEEHPDDLILGVRDFSQDHVPPKSAMGNKITRRFIKFLFGLQITDTQTGLRAIPNGYARKLLRVKGERYEFETTMLLETKRMDVGIHEVPIHTIYIDDNSASHFRPVADSWRIYKLILRCWVIYFFLKTLRLIKFSLSSLISFGVDMGLFAFLNAVLGAFSPALRLFIATAGARVISAVCNFFVNRTVVFKSEEQVGGAMFRYAVLAICQMFCSYGGVYALNHLLPIPNVVAKMLVDITLFFISFYIQRKWVFKAGIPEMPKVGAAAEPTNEPFRKRAS